MLSSSTPSSRRPCLHPLRLQLFSTCYWSFTDVTNCRNVPSSSPRSESRFPFLAVRAVPMLHSSKVKDLIFPNGFFFAPSCSFLSAQQRGLANSCSFTPRNPPTGIRSCFFSLALAQPAPPSVVIHSCLLIPTIIFPVYPALFQQLPLLYKGSRTLFLFFFFFFFFPFSIFPFAHFVKPFPRSDCVCTRESFLPSPASLFPLFSTLAVLS